MKKRIITGDNVLKLDTTAPVMRVEGLAMKANYPNYTTPGDIYICLWLNQGGGHRKEYHESELVHAEVNEITIMLAENRKLLDDKLEQEPPTNKASVLQNKMKELNRIQDLYNDRERSYIYQYEITKNFKADILRLNKEIIAL